MFAITSILNNKLDRGEVEAGVIECVYKYTLSEKGNIYIFFILE